MPAHAPLRERFLADTPEARRLVAAVLYVVFVPLASSVEVAHGAVGRHAVLFAAASAFLALQLVLCLVLARLGDRVSLFLVFAVPATFAAYVSAAPAAGDALWPCLVLPVAWTAVFLPTRLVALSVLLNGAATGWQLSGQPLGWSDAVAVAIRVLTLVVMAVIVHGLVSTLRRTRDHAQGAEQALREVERRRDEVLSELLRMQDAQRSHIATELHDDTVQVMTASVLSLDRLCRSVDAGRFEQARAAARTARESLGAALERTRRLMFDLRPQVLEAQGLDAALAELVAVAAGEAGFETSVAAPTRRYPALVEELVYRTVREAVTNARRHSAARLLRVEVHEQAGRLAGAVVDDGRGFDPREAARRAARAPHLGLATMAERIRLAGGDFRVVSQPGAGTAIHFSLPLSAGEAGPDD